MIKCKILFDIDSPITHERLLNKGDVVKSYAPNQRKIDGYMLAVKNKNGKKVNVFKHEIEVLK